MKRSLVAAIVTGSVATVAMVAGLSPRTADVPTVVVERSSFVDRVLAEGNLRAVERTPLTSGGRFAGRLYKIAWMVPEGSAVAAGDVVVRFDPTDVEEDRRQGLDEGKIVEHKLDKASVQRGGELDNLDRDAAQAERELEQAETFQATDSDLYSRLEIVEDAIDTDLARERAQHAEATREIRDDLSQAEIELLDIERRQAQLKVDQAEQRLRDLELVAPHAGVVTYERDWRGNTLRVGDTVFPGSTVATIPDPSSMEAEVFVLEADAGGLSPGQRASVVIDAHPERRYLATVKSVAPIAEPRLRSVPVQYFETVLALDETVPGIMKPGQRVRAEIVVAAAEDALTVPLQAVVERDGERVVFRRARTDFEAVPVELGAAALGRVVVTAGLTAGDEIALRDPSAPTAGAHDGAATAARPPGIGQSVSP